MERKYIRVKPSREELNPDDVVSHISSLHKLKNRTESSSMFDRINPAVDTGPDIPRFEFIAISQGKNAPVEFYYGVDSSQVGVLRKRLKTAYPESFDVEEVTVDLLEKLIPPEEYSQDEFLDRLENNDLQASEGTKDDLEGDHLDDHTDSEDDTTLVNVDGDSGGGGGDDESDSDSGDETDGFDPTPDDERLEIEDEDDLRDDVPEGADLPDRIDAGLLDKIAPPVTVETDDVPVNAIEGPTWTDDGNILARPTLEHGEPVAAIWRGHGERKKDWMTTMKMFSNIANPGDEDLRSRAPLATLIQHLAESSLPIGFQVVFEKMNDWSRLAEKRKENLHLNRDTLGQKVVYELGELIHESSEERRREKRRDFFEEMGETAGGDESVVSGDVAERAALIDNKVPKRTFRTNIRAVSVATGEIDVDHVKQELHNLSSVLDHLDGYFYGMDPKIVSDQDGGWREKAPGTREFHRLIDRHIETGSGEIREDLVLNADELANFLSVPSSKDLTVEGARGTRADPESRDPLPRPDPDLMREFHQPGMRVGYALDENADPEGVPTQIEPSLLTKHFGRFATTGAGKSKALINDILSLHENTEGPVILIDPKGDGMPQNYMRTHFERFGPDSIKDQVIHFPIPEILPGFTFFNIEPALEQGQRRADAIQNKADHYEELLKLVMGAERYRESKVAPTIIKALIKALFDKRHGKKRDGRESSNYFSHHDLEHAATELRKAVSEEDDQEGSIPMVQDDRVRETLTRHTESDPREFATIMNAVFNRLDYIREDTHLRKIFDNTDRQFDFRDHLNDDKIILFDLGDLRDDATMIMTGLILTNMWDALQEHSRTKCTEGHDSMEECKDAAGMAERDRGLPPCREPWSDDHLVNLIIDEAASVAVSDIMNKMLEQGRSFHLSVGLSMQFPEQMKSTGERAYRNVLNNVATLLIGQIRLDEEIAEAMAHEDMTPEEFSNRIKALPRGEWIAQLPSPQFMETGPEPFSVQPLPIPSGHPESDNPLTGDDEDTFKHYMDNLVHGRTEDKYGIEQERSPYSDVSAYNTPDDTVGAAGEGDEEGDTVGDSDDAEDAEEDESGDASADNEDSSVNFGVTDTTRQNADVASENTPDHVVALEDGFECKRCGSFYPPGEVEKAADCCPKPQTDADATTGSTNDDSSDDSPYGGGAQADDTVSAAGEGTTEQDTASDTADEDNDTTESGEGTSRYEPGTDDIDTTAIISDADDFVDAIESPTPDALRGVGAAVVQALPDEYEMTAKAVFGNVLADFGVDLEYTGEELYEKAVETEPVPVGVVPADIVESIPLQNPSDSLATHPLFPGSDAKREEQNSELADVGFSPSVSTDIEKAQIEYRSPVDYDEDMAEELGLTSTEVNFLYTVLKAMNNELENYNLLMSMSTAIKRLFDSDDLDLEKLVREGLLIIHKTSNNRKYYTVTGKGRDLLKEPLEYGSGMGDLGDHTPHRVGVKLMAKYLLDHCEEVDSIQTVKSVDTSNKYVDLIAFDEDGEPTHVVEVEAGKTKKDLTETSLDKDEDDFTPSDAGINDYDSMAGDYDQLAKVDGAEAIWVVRTKDQIFNLLKALQSKDKIDFDEDDPIETWQSNRYTWDKFYEEHVQGLDTPGLNDVMTFTDLRSVVED